MPTFNAHVINLPNALLSCRSSGGGGSSKGPSTVDKRGQEQKCPHCDRVFKQNNRLHEHIKKQHTELNDAPAQLLQTTAEQPPSKKLMEVGSSTGYYSGKSPKMLLHEWCLKEKIPRPKYKPISGESEGSWRCRVVLPHPKRADKDTILFLKESVPSEEDAMQRAAVVALHHLAGDRSLERVLPADYRDQWRTLAEQAHAREMAMASSARRKEAQAARAAAAAKRRGPATVYMTEDKRQLLSNILQDARAETGEYRDAACCPEGSEGREIVVQELEALGFKRDDAQRALDAIPMFENVSSALDWLCLHLPESSLPARFAPGAAGKPISVLSKAFKPEDDDWNINDGVPEAVIELSKYGYPPLWCKEALKDTNGDIPAALPCLYSKLSGRIRPVSEGMNDEWLEEKAVLQAIYEEDVSFPSPHWVIVKQMVKGVGSALYIEVMVGDDYPSAPPVFIGVRCSSLAPPCLATVTKNLSTIAGTSLIGSPMMYEIVQSALELLPGSVATPLSVIELLGTNEVDLIEDFGSGICLEEVQSPMENTVTKMKQQSTKKKATDIDTQAENERLVQRACELAQQPQHDSMRDTRMKLPAAAKRSTLLHLIQDHRVVVISGATGCGKSTQVPQFILEEAIQSGAGARCNIICTQPRRISAIGLATRVSAERGESIGDVVGYSVRLDHRQSVRTRLLFCTTGILLRRLLSDSSLCTTTHVVLDEVHERTIESDLLLLLLRRLLSSNQNPKLKVILMSATANSELFARYFEPALGRPSGIINIPGFTHPVQDLFLENVLESTGFVVGRNSKWAKRKIRTEPCMESQDIGYSRQTAQSLQNIDESLVNYDLIGSLVAHICSTAKEPTGAILIFAPGGEEINRICRLLQNVSLSDGQKLQVLPLHGALPPSQQAKVFKRPPSGYKKVVVSTNVAETSITIDDVTVVIDTGRVKEMGFDPQRGIARLQEGWVSHASAQQRRGRAGRVQPGTCWRLYSHTTWDKAMATDTAPEVERVPLQGLILDIKGVLGAETDVAVLLNEMLTPPNKVAVNQAQQSLAIIGALDSTFKLTPLGQHIAQMPCDPRIGKMLLFGAILRCLDPVLTIAAAQTFGKPLFFSPPDKRDEAEIAKKNLVSSVAVSKSDHIAIVAVYNKWKAATVQGGRRAAAEFCNRHFLSDQAMEIIEAGRRQYADVLADLGFAPRSYLSQPQSTLDTYSHNARVVKSAITAGLYPQLLRVLSPTAKYQKVLGGAMETDNDPSQFKFFDKERGRVFLHPASVNFHCGKFESGWLAYSDIVETSKVFVRESSMVPVYSILLFGGDLTVHHDQGLIKVDDWAQFKAPGRIAVLVKELRSEVASLLARKIQDPKLDLTGSKVIEALHHLLSTDGF